MNLNVQTGIGFDLYKKKDGSRSDLILQTGTVSRWDLGREEKKARVSENAYISKILEIKIPKRMCFKQTMLLT